jgi:hypothetical protein
MKKILDFNSFINESKNAEGLTPSQINFLNKSVKKGWLSDKNGSSPRSLPGTWKMNSKGEIDVDGNVVCSKLLSQIPVQFGEITGNFECIEWKKLTSLEGSPRKVGGIFKVYKCPSLKSLKGSPVEVKDSFIVTELQLTSLEGSPEKVGSFRCISMQKLTSLKGSSRKVKENFTVQHCLSLESLEGGPEVVEGDFYCCYNPKLVTLKGSPKTVGKDFTASDNLSLESLEGGPEEVGGDFSCSWNAELVTLKGSPESVGGTFVCNGNASLITIFGAPKDASSYEFERCKSLLNDEKELINNVDLIKDYLNSSLSAKDFLHKKRGTIKGKEFGF